ncbi:helix-turn-helix transcriptional regulator [Chryseobacterium sp. C-17]|uniref:Helix-turn-helix transcriptional regulator n=1 Tax=Chryseobacterium turcicum TaxID=2898076 RepID=A0A9Q3YYZ5_9FLAO|nr:helix-turn-helix transcriptional regulator [Chryseobacterium turcicum]
MREEMHFSQAQLAFELGISQGTLHNIESGHSRKIDFLLVDKICQFFDKDFKYFLDEKTVNNINENHGQTVFLNNLQENYLEEFKNLVLRNKENEEIIKELKNKLNF